jgi:hypothetical protein
MTRYSKIGMLSLLALLICAPLAPAGARGLAPAQGSPEPTVQTAGAEAGTTTITTVVSVVGPKDTVPPLIDKRDVNVISGKTHLDVTGWALAQSIDQGKLQLAILIDNDVRSTILGQQLQDLSHFITSLPPNVAVGVFYGEYGAATVAAPFSTDLQAVSRALRISEGRGGDSPSIYLSLADLVSRWQPDGAIRREVLILTSGIDALHPGLLDPYFDSTLDKVQRAGVEVYTIFDGSSRFGFSFAGDISQSKLITLSNEAGGQAFMEGPETPISITGYLSELGSRLKNQYLLTFTMEPSKHAKGELRNIEVRLEQRNLKMSYPHAVFVPAAGAPKD